MSIVSRLFSKDRRKDSEDNDSPSFLRNMGKISFTYKDGGIYGKFINTSRIDAWRYAVDQLGIDRSSILDVGCSYGSWAENYRSLGFEKLKGIDPNPEAIDSAREVFDECEVASSLDVANHYPDNNTIAANGVLVHILEPKEVVRFFKDVANVLSVDGHFLFSVINARWYYSSGRREQVGDVSCTRFIERYREWTAQAGLEIGEIIGTFIDPWAVRDLEFIAQDLELREEWKLYQVFLDLASVLRGRSVDPFSEALVVARKASN